MERIVLYEENFNKLKELVKNNKGKEIIFSSNDDELNRKVLEKLPINILLIPLEGRKDFSKQRNSGFNEVMSGIALKNKIKIGISLDEFINSKEKEKIISRIKQNIKLCTRNKVGMVFIEGEEKRSSVLLKSLALTLGMPTWMTKEFY
ncbi:MAG: hypothetical protein NUV46_03045 [Nanoarchaeota archaeon]|nr:hypothetical protein [Nanoarchaeota archaeon]